MGYGGHDMNNDIKEATSRMPILIIRFLLERYELDPDALIHVK